MSDVVSITHKHELEALQVSEMFLQRENVGKRLAWMIDIAERVDDRDTGPKRQVIDRLLFERARDNAIGPARQIPRDVFQRLALSNHARLSHAITPELLDREFKRQPRA